MLETLTEILKVSEEETGSEDLMLILLHQSITSPEQTIDENTDEEIRKSFDEALEIICRM